MLGDHEVAVGAHTLTHGKMAVTLDVIAQRMPAYRSTFRIRFSNFENAISFQNVFTNKPYATTNSRTARNFVHAQNYTTYTAYCYTFPIRCQ